MKNLILAFIWTLMTITPVFAVKVTSLYEVELPVSSQAADARAEAVKLGFIQVLIRLTGDPDVDKNPLLKENIDRADYFVQEYSYALPSPASSQYQITIHYNAADVNRLLRKTNMPIWGENRPLLLVWLTMASANEPAEIMNSETSSDLLDDMQQQGKKLGLPLIFPVMDVDDLNQVTAEDVQSVGLQVIKKVSVRYAPDAYLIGNIQQTIGGYDSEWHLVMHNDQWDWTISDPSLETIVTKALYEVRQTLSNRVAAKSIDTKSHWVNLEVRNVTDRNELVKLIDYMSQLSPVKQVQLSQVAGEVVKMAVRVNGPLDSFQQNTLSGQRLILQSQKDGANISVYEWTH